MLELSSGVVLHCFSFLCLLPFFHAVSSACTFILCLQGNKSTIEILETLEKVSYFFDGNLRIYYYCVVIYIVTRKRN